MIVFDNKFLKGWNPYLIIALVGFILYAKALSFDFTHLDDKQLIVDNFSFIGNVSNAFNAFQYKAFPDSIIPYYRPILTLSLMLDAQFGGQAPLVYHLTNVMMHIAVVCLLYTLLLMLGHRKGASFFFAVLFTVHPVLAETVAWVPGRNDLLLAVFCLLAFMSFLKYLDGAELTYLIAHTVFFALALFTKESAVVLVPLFILYTYTKKRERFNLKGLLPAAIVWFVIGAVWFLMRQAALSGTLRTPLDGMAMALVTSLPALIQFIGKAVIPAGLSVFPTIRDTAFIYGIMAIIMIAAAFRFSRHTDKKLAAFGLLWFLSFLLISFIRPTHKVVLDFQEHRIYVAMIGFMIMLLEIDALKDIDLTKRKTIVACVLLVTVFSAISFAYTENFRDRRAYWDNAVRTSPSSSFVHLRVGFIYHLDGMLDKAEEEYDKSIAIDTTTPMAHLKRGLLYMDKGMYDKAENEFRKEIEVYPPSDNAYLSLGVVYYKKGRSAEAEELWKKTLEINPNNIDAIKNLAIYHGEKKDLPAAISYVNELKKRGVTPPQEFLRSLGML